MRYSLDFRRLPPPSLVELVSARLVPGLSLVTPLASPASPTLLAESSLGLLRSPPRFPPSPLSSPPLSPVRSTTGDEGVRCPSEQLAALVSGVPEVSLGPGVTKRLNNRAFGAGVGAGISCMSSSSSITIAWCLEPAISSLM